MAGVAFSDSARRLIATTNRPQKASKEFPSFLECFKIVLDVATPNGYPKSIQKPVVLLLRVIFLFATLLELFEKPSRIRENIVPQNFVSSSPKEHYGKSKNRNQKATSPNESSPPPRKTAASLADGSKQRVQDALAPEKLQNLQRLDGRSGESKALRKAWGFVWFCVFFQAPSFFFFFLNF